MQSMPDLVEDVLKVMETQSALDRQIVNANKRHYALHFSPLLREQNRVAGAILLFTDNTTLYETERIARENQERLLAVMNNSVSMMAVKDASGRYQFVNPKFEHSFGFTPGQVVGKTDFQLFPPTVSELFRVCELEAMRQRKDIEREETLQLGGEDRHFLVVRFPLFDDDGAITGVCFQATDITERKHAEEQLRLAARVFDRAAEGVMVTDIHQKVLTINDAFTNVTGYTREEMVGQTPRMLASGKHVPEFYTEMWAKIATHGWWQGEIWNRKKDGELYLEWLSINTVKDQAGNVVNYVAMFSDITQVRESQNRVEFLATHDDLTGLPNRTLFNDRLRQALARAGRSSKSMAVFFIDLDDFKVVNDTLGHNVGDKLLKQTASRLLDCVRAEDTVARLGGDEFVVLLEGAGRHEAAMTAQRIIRDVSKGFQLDPHECFVTTSIGISMFPEDATEPSGLMRNADAAMYRAKDHGKNSFQFFTSELADLAAQRMDIETGLRHALERHELELYFQPQIQLQTHAVAGAEALVRWRHGDTLVSPAVFIPISEESQLIVAIDQWVLAQACRQIGLWDQAGLPAITISVNFSARHFRKPDMVAEVMRIITEHGVNPQRLCIEITESVLMDVDRAQHLLAELVAFGLHISLDDFGTGFSSLSYLKRFPIHELKIDKSFVDGIASNDEDRAIARTIIALANNLRMKVVAEGVELREQDAALHEQGCSFGQGYLYAKPMPADLFADWLLYRPEE
jgi:two-component system CheB/CheR fusion protein